MTSELTRGTKARSGARAARRIGHRCATVVAWLGALGCPPCLVSAGATGAGIVLISRITHADEGVPYARQAELLIKVAPYDKSFAARVGDVVRISLVSRPGSDGASRAAAQLSAALSGVTIEGHAVEVTQDSFSSAAALAQTCKDRHLAVVYLLPGLSADMPAIAEALAGLDVLSVAAEPEMVSKRAVLGFDLVSGKPKLLVHLAQARRQNVDFKAEVLKLMKVVE